MDLEQSKEQERQEEQERIFSQMMPDEDGYGKFASLEASALVRLANIFLEEGYYYKASYPEANFPQLDHCKKHRPEEARPKEGCPNGDESDLEEYSLVRKFPQIAPGNDDDQERIDDKRVDDKCIDKECIDKECIDKECIDKECINEERGVEFHKQEHPDSIHPKPDSSDQTRKPTGSLGEKYLIFLHINTNEASRDYKINKSATCSVDNNRFLAPEVARRLACDAQITTVLEDDKGNVLNIGRRSRVIPRAMAHALRIRDGGCLYPGCCQSKYTDAHHIKHWADGGETNMENLATLCTFHHSLLHKGEYRIHREDNGDLVFTNKHNKVVTKSFYPQFPEHLSSELDVDPSIDEHTAECKWLGEQMDIQMALNGLFRLDGK
ncbi:MAG: HNH endonuclease signature motif containing protein [bacterium]